MAFPLLSCVPLRWVWHLYNSPCVSAFFWPISIARYVFKSPSICFWGTKYDVYCERVAYLHSMSWRRARLWLELFASTVGRFLSRVSYLPSYISLLRRCKFTLRKLYACLKILIFLAAIWLSLCFCSSMDRFIPPLIVTVLCVVRLSSGEPPCIIFIFISKAKCPLRNIWGII